MSKWFSEWGRGWLIKMLSILDGKEKMGNFRSISNPAEQGNPFFCYNLINLRLNVSNSMYSLRILNKENGQPDETGSCNSVIFLLNKYSNE